jgi:hypothetical protein
MSAIDRLLMLWMVPPLARKRPELVADEVTMIRRRQACRRSRQSLDIAKLVFQVHGGDAAGGVVVRHVHRASTTAETFFSARCNLQFAICN